MVDTVGSSSSVFATSSVSRGVQTTGEQATRSNFNAAWIVPRDGATIVQVNTPKAKALPEVPPVAPHP